VEVVGSPDWMQSVSTFASSSTSFAATDGPHELVHSRLCAGPQLG
jgi:hypothetical protein